MDLFDEDLFSASDEDDRVENVKTLSPGASNPVKEHLLRQLDDTTERVEKARGNVDRVRAVTEEIRKKLELRETRGVSSESETEESELYQVTGDPVIPKKRIRKQTGSSESLRIQEIWQRVIDDKWIIGICLENTSNRTLCDPRAYMMVKDETEIRGCSSFWQINDFVTTRTDQIGNGQSNKTTATVVVDLPDFSDKDSFVAFGTICYYRGEKYLQIPVPPVRLTCHDAVNQKFAPKFSNGPEQTMLALKSISIDREIIIPHDKEGIGARLGNFLNDNAFKPIGDEFSDVYVAEGNEFLRRCIFEVLELEDTGAPVRISARTPKQLEIMVSLVRAQFSDLVLNDTRDRETEAARALERELELELAGDDPEALRLARFITDLLIP